MTELKRLFDQAVLKAEQRSWIPGRLGVIAPDGGIRIESSRPGFVHVRLGPEGTLGNSIAKNLGVPLRANLPVRMRRENGVLVIYGVDNAGEGAKNDTQNPFGTQPHHHRIGSGLEYEHQALLLEPGRVRYDSGRTVHINPFRYYTNGAWETYEGGTLDLTSFIPATTGEWAWVLVGVDPSTNTATAVAGASVGYATPLTVADLDAINFGDNIPLAGVRIRNDDGNLHSIAKYADAKGWIFSPSGSDHGSLSGLGDDDHTQYLDISRHDTTARHGSSVVDHGSIGGLADDDHTQYALLAGRAGGQDIKGGTAASDNLTLDSTASGTKGNVYIQPGTGGVGMGVASGGTLASRLVVKDGASGEQMRFIRGTGEVRLVQASNVDDLTFYNSDASLPLLSLRTSQDGVGIRTVAPREWLSVGSAAETPAYGSAAAIGVYHTSTVIFRARNTAVDAEGHFGVDSVGNGYGGMFTNHPFGFRTNNANRFWITASGEMGIGTTSPQGQFHVHDTVGGMLFVTKTSVAGTAVTVIPNGTGDVVSGLYLRYVVVPSTGTVQAGTSAAAIVPGGSAVQIFNSGSGANVVTFTVNADGSADVQRTVGTLTYTVVLDMIWR